MSEKIKVFTIGDHPLSPSGVGTQSKYIIEGLLATGKYKFMSFGGAIKHPSHEPQTTEQWGEDWIIWPVDGYGTAEQVRAMIHQNKPDILWFMTDPRFYGWLWDIENEIRAHVPMVYYHVWDNFPAPMFNRPAYLSNDHIVCISKVTHEIVKAVSPEVDNSYLPHAVNGDIFQPMTDADRISLRKEKGLHDKFVCVWNNRNARRKMSGSLIYWFKEFLDKVGHDKACLIMHTDVKDQHGQDLEAIIHELGLIRGEILFSTLKIGAPDLAMMYNMGDLTINISDAEGFGLGTLESPIFMRTASIRRNSWLLLPNYMKWGTRNATRSERLDGNMFKRNIILRTLQKSGIRPSQPSTKSMALGPRARDIRSTSLRR